MNKDIMSYCGDGILDDADKYWEKAKKRLMIRRITLICAAALLAAGMIAAAFITVSKINIPKPTLPPDTEATSPVYGVSDDEDTEAGVPANDGTAKETEEEDKTTESGMLTETEEEDETTEAGMLTETEEEDEKTEAGILTETEEEGETTEAGTVAGVTTGRPEMTDGEDTVNDMTGEAGIERPTKAFSNYGDYLDFLAETDHNSKIIEYEKLKTIGKFRSFVLLSDDFSQYKYAFDDGSGFTVNLTVTDTAVRKDTNNYDIIDPSDYGTDLRALRSDVSGLRYIGDTEYMYVRGKLLCIRWKNDDIEFILSGDSMFDGYPQGVNTFTAKLMDEQTAAECIKSLKTGE